MTYFADADEVYETIGRTLALVSDDEMLGVHQADTVIRNELSDPDSSITLSLRPWEPSRVDFGETDLEAEILMSMPADVAHRFWLGEVNVALALARGEIRASGPSTKMLRLVPLLKPAFARYRELSALQGRKDLARA